ncbi:MAG: helix-turn-helix domain-containing protein [Coriobacteriia bacterium]|nr:helix-turn-helix domain-containing protein [Coriobacteriia bacterium]
MNDKLLECLTNPTRNILLLEVYEQGQATAKTLAQKHPNIPQATLYRHLKKMTDDGVLKIAHERQVRNVTEKVYAVAVDLDVDVEEMFADDSGELYLQLYQQFSTGLLKEFMAYAAQDNIDIVNDGSGFRVTPIYATLDELKELSAKINELIKPYKDNEPTLGRKARSIATIITPPTAED